MRLFLVGLIVNCVVSTAGRLFPFKLPFFRDHYSNKTENIPKDVSRCYDEYGCFSIGGSFTNAYRPINLFPNMAECYHTKLLLFTRNNPNDASVLILRVAHDLSTTNFNFSLPTKVITHGYTEDGTIRWQHNMKNELLGHGDYNVIILDWGSGSLPPYTKATANIRLVAAMLERFFQILLKIYKYRPENIHIIGHSLGAHLAGYVGQRIGSAGPSGPHLGRISGLDPAGPYFENTAPEVRLDPTDAIFVDVIHTDASIGTNKSFGMIKPVGHIDFYPNGGEQQPGCEDEISDSIVKEKLRIVKGMVHWIACGHIRSHLLFTESINSECQFQAYECSSFSEFIAGNCFKPCTDYNKRARMGFHADVFNTKVAPKSMYLMTFAESPFCSTHFLVRVQIRLTKSFLTSVLNTFTNGSEKGFIVKINGDDRYSVRIPFQMTSSDIHTFQGVAKYGHRNYVNRVTVELDYPDAKVKTMVLSFVEKFTPLEVLKVSLEHFEKRQLITFCNKRSYQLTPISSLTLYSSTDC